MLKEFLGSLLGQKKVEVVSVIGDLPEDKPDYTGAVVLGVSILSILAIFYFITKK